MLIELWCRGWKQFERNLTLKYLISSPLSLPPLLVLSVFLPANSSLVTLSTTRSSSQSQTGRRRPEEDGEDDYSFQLHPAIIWHPRHLKNRYIQGMLTKHICSFSYLVLTQYWGPSSKVRKDDYRFTAPVWTYQVQDFNCCPSGYARYFMQAHALCSKTDREMSLPSMRGYGGADATGNRQVWHLNNWKCHFFKPWQMLNFLIKVVLFVQMKNLWKGWVQVMYFCHTPFKVCKGNFYMISLKVMCILCKSL